MQKPTIFDTKMTSGQNSYHRKSTLPDSRPISSVSVQV
jgi:hypothetical protein